jgi:hypothetical protein
VSYGQSEEGASLVRRPERRWGRRLADAVAFQQFVDTLYRVEWVVYAKRPFGGPQQVLGPPTSSSPSP